MKRSPLERGPTCSIADIEMNNIVLVQKQSAKVSTTRCQHCLVGLEVYSIHHKRAVTEKTQLTLFIELSKDFPTVPRKVHIGWA